MEFRIGYSEIKSVVGLVKKVIGKEKKKISIKDTFPSSWKKKKDKHDKQGEE